MRVAARRGSIVEHSALAGCSILVVEEEPFIAHCLKVLLEDAGVDVHGATSAADALHISDRKTLTAGVLACSKGTKGCRRVAQRLVRLDVPFVICMDAGQLEEWPGVPVLIKPVRGFQVLETLGQLINAKAERLRIAAESLCATEKNLPLAGVHTLRPSTNIKEIPHGKS
jgi:CheY-like chemotaxis protein